MQGDREEGRDVGEGLWREGERAGDKEKVTRGERGGGCMPFGNTNSTGVRYELHSRYACLLGVCSALQACCHRDSHALRRVYGPWRLMRMISQPRRLTHDLPYIFIQLRCEQTASSSTGSRVPCTSQIVLPSTSCHGCRGEGHCTFSFVKPAPPVPVRGPGAETPLIR